MAQAPPLRAVVPPLRESRWTPEWQRKILQRELLSLSFYRRLTTADAAQQRLLERLEEEFDALVADASSCTVGQVYAVRFPPMRGRHRSLVAAVASLAAAVASGSKPCATQVDSCIFTSRPVQTSPFRPRQ